MVVALIKQGEYLGIGGGCDSLQGCWLIVAFYWLFVVVVLSFVVGSRYGS